MESDIMLFTLKFPFGKGETFIEAEIEVLSKKFRKIYLVPLGSDIFCRHIPKNVEILNVINNSAIEPTLRIGQKIDAFFYFLIVALKDMNRAKYFGRLKYLFSYFKKIYFKSEVISHWISTNKKTTNSLIFYSYWFDESATILSILKAKKRIQKFCSRAHGFDLYDSRNEFGFIPFRKWQLKNIDKVFTVSNEGRNYLIKNYPAYKNKIETSYLGIINNKERPESSKELFTIVSCSNVISLKRVELIASTVLKCNFPLKWIHFGDGANMNQIVELIEANKNDLIQCEMKGRVSNSELMDYYSHNHIDLFVNLSLSEGLPVSVMEAISFGIPVLATNVGGTSEIVNHITGVLVDVDTSSNDIIAHIKSFKRKDRVFNRNEIRKFFLDNFSATKNYSVFAEDLKNYSNDI